MLQILNRAFVVILLLALLSNSCLAFESPLSDKTIREAYFLGQHHDASTAAALRPYIHNLPVPPKGPYISEIGLLTPYAQVIDVSNSQSAGYSAQQAAADYHARTDTILVRVRIEFTPTYGYIESSGERAGGPRKGISLRPQDFWQAFRIGLSQNDQWIEPLSTDGEATYAPNAESGSVMTGALIWVFFDARDLDSAPATAEVFTPDGQHISSKFDLASLR